MSLQPRYSSSSLILVTTTYYDSRVSSLTRRRLSKILYVLYFDPKRQQEDEQLANEDWLVGESVGTIGGSRKCWFYLILFTTSIHRFRFPIFKLPRKTPQKKHLKTNNTISTNNFLSDFKTVFLELCCCLT